jgi:hypothetical protein
VKLLSVCLPYTARWSSTQPIAFKQEMWHFSEENGVSLALGRMANPSTWKANRRKSHGDNPMAGGCTSWTIRLMPKS